MLDFAKAAFIYVVDVRRLIRQLIQEVQKMSAATDALAVEVNRAVAELGGDAGTIATLKQQVSDGTAALAAKQGELDTVNATVAGLVVQLREANDKLNPPAATIAST